MTLVAGKRRSLLMARNDEVYDKKPQRYTEDNIKHYSRHYSVEANY